MLIPTLLFLSRFRKFSHFINDEFCEKITLRKQKKSKIIKLLFSY